MSFNAIRENKNSHEHIWMFSSMKVQDPIHKELQCSRRTLSSSGVNIDSTLTAVNIFQIWDIYDQRP